jgi:DNA-binding beta-propeller fold protein YncE
MLFQRYSNCQDQICFETSWASLGTKEGEFNQTSGVAVKSSGNVYVVDERNDRIQKFKEHKIMKLLLILRIVVFFHINSVQK